jgi:hypothetical protein
VASIPSCRTWGNSDAEWGDSSTARGEENGEEPVSAHSRPVRFYPIGGNGARAVFIRSMDDTERFRLLSKLRTPRFRIGQTVRCAIRGEVTISGINDAPILWPIGKRGRSGRSLVVYKDLLKAIRRGRACGFASCLSWLRLLRGICVCQLTEQVVSALFSVNKQKQEFTSNLVRNEEEKGSAI